MANLRRARTRELRAAVVGGGVSGTACARTLAAAGVDVTLFDKARGLGGRTSTRREGATAFDHGAAFFHTVGKRFHALVDEALAAGAIAPWTGRIRLIDGGQVGEVVGAQQRFVAVPGMSGLTRFLAGGVASRTACRVAEVVPEGSGWRLGSEDGADLGLFDVLVIAVPAAQAVPLLVHAPELADALGEVRMAPTWSVMVSWDQALELPFEAAYVPMAPVGLLVHDGAKPQRGGGESWVLHGSTGWSTEHIGSDPQTVCHALVLAASSAVGRRLPEPSHTAAHLWRYAAVLAPLGVDFLLDEKRGLGACGDWGRGSTVENAVMSGISLAEAILSRSR